MINSIIGLPSALIPSPIIGWQNQPNFEAVMNQPALNTPQATILHWELLINKNVLELDASISSYFINALNDLKFFIEKADEYSLSDMVSFIHQGVLQKGFAIWPIRTNNCKNIVICEFFQRNNTLYCRIMDKSLTSVHEYSETRAKHLYCLPDMDLGISLDDFVSLSQHDDSFIRSLLQRLITIHTDTKNNYSKQDVKNILLTALREEPQAPDSTVGRLVSSWVDNRDQWELACKLLLRDLLVANNCSQKDIDRVFFLYRRDAMSRTMNHEPALLKAFLAQTNKAASNQAITPQEEIETVLWIQQQLDKPSLSSVLQPSFKIPRDAVAKPNLRPRPLRKDPVEERSVPPETTATFSRIEEYAPAKLSSVLGEAKEKVGKVFDSMKEKHEDHYLSIYTYIQELFQAFPWIQDDFWDQIPSQDRLLVLKHIKSLTSYGMDSILLYCDRHSHKGCRLNATAQATLLIHHAWAICIRLLQQDPSLALRGHHFVNRLTPTGPLFMTQDEVRLFRQINQYLEGLKECGVGDNALFDFTLLQTPRVHVKNTTYWLSETLVLFGEDQAEPTVVYLRQLAGGSPVVSFLYKQLENPDSPLALLIYFGYLANLKIVTEYRVNTLNWEISLLEKNTQLSICAVDAFVPEHRKMQNIHSFPPYARATIEAVNPKWQSRGDENSKVLEKSPDQSVLALDPNVYHALLQIRVEPALQVENALAFCHRHMEFLHLPAVQAYLELCFFEASAIASTDAVKGKNQIGRLRGLADRLLIRFPLTLTNFSSALFWLRVAYCFETHYAGSCDFTRIKYFQDQIVRFKAQLADLESIQFYEATLVQVYLFSHLQPKTISREQIVQLALPWMELILPSRKNLPIQTPWLALEASHILRRHQSGFIELLSEQETAQEILKRLPIATASADSWQGVFPYYNKGFYKINLSTGEVVYNKDQILTLDWPNEIKKDNRFEQFVEKLLPSPLPPICLKRVWVPGLNGHTYTATSLDGKWEYFQTPQLFHLSQRIKTEHGDGWFKYHPPAPSSLPTNLTIDCSAWVQTNLFDGQKSEPGQAPLLLILNSEGLAIAESYLHKSQPQHFNPIVNNKLIEEEVLINFDELENAQKDYIEAIVAEPSTVRLWAAAESLCLSWLEFPHSTLTFRFTEREGSLEASCSLFPGSYLAKEQGITLHGLKGAVSLVDSLGMPQVLLPCTHFERSDFIDSSARMEERYFLYDYDPTQKILRAKCDAAALYLVYVTASQGLYAEALDYLDRTNSTKPFSLTEWKILSRILCGPTEFMSYCVYLQLAKLVIENSHLFDRSTKIKDPEIESFKRSFWNDLSDHLVNFYNTNSQRSQKMPGSRGLSQRDHQNILNEISINGFMGEPHSQKNTTLSTVKKRLSAGQEIIAAPQDPLPLLTESEDSLRLYPDLWKKQKVLPTDFIKLENAQGLFLFHYFVDLYQRARLAGVQPSPIDLDLRCLQPMAIHRISKQLLHILLAVRKQPEKFPESCSNPEEFANVLKSAREISLPTPSSLPIQPYKPVAKKIVRPTYQRVNEVQPISWPAQKEFSTYFTAEQKTYDAGRFVLSDVQGTTPLAEKMIDDLKSEYKQLTHVNVYKGKPGVAYQGLKTHIQDLENKINQTQRELNELINFGTQFGGEYTLDEIKRMSRQLQQQEKPLDLYDFLPFFCNNDADGMRSLNPYLSGEQVQQLTVSIRTYLEQITHLNLLREANASQDIQEIAGLLNKRRNYDPVAFPALLVYEFATGKFLRPEQAELLQWIFNGLESDIRQLLFEFEAGGGKTNILAVIIAYRIIQQGKIPIFFSLSELQDIIQGNIKDPLMQAFRVKISTLSCGLHDQLSLVRLKDLRTALQDWKTDGRVCVTCPETFHSLRLQYRFALDRADLPALEVLHDILGFFKEHAVFMIDEAHRNADALWQFIIAAGIPQSLEQDEQQLFVYLYKSLFGYGQSIALSDGRLLQEVLDLQHNGQAKTTAADMGLILVALRKHLVSYSPLAIAPKDQAEILGYWAHEHAQVPRCVAEHDGSKNAIRREQLIVLVRGLLQQILPTVLGMVRVMDYDASPVDKDDTASPCTMAQVSQAKYEMPDMAAALSTQLLFQTGLQTPQIAKLVQEFLRQHEIDCKAGHSVTQASQQFLAWQEGAETILELGQLACISDSQLLELQKSLGKHPKAIEWYLTSKALSQIQLFPEKFSTSYADLLDGGHKAIVFSATLGLKEQYLFDPHVAMRSGVQFHAAVIQRACHSRNETIYWENANTLQGLLASVWDKYPDCARLDGIIDVGGWFACEDTEYLAREFLAFSVSRKLDYEGVVYVNKNDKVCLLYKEGDLLKIKQFEGSNLREELKNCGKQKDRLFKIFDAPHTTGLDLFIDPSAELMVTFGEGITGWNQIQGTMRMRGFLKILEDLKAGQGIIWLGHKKLRDKIAQISGNDLSPIGVMTFAVEQQAKRQSEILRSRAFLGILHIVQNCIQRLIDRADGPDQRCVLFKKHRAAFVESIERDTIRAFGLPLTQENVDVVLINYKETLCEEAKIELEGGDHQLISGIIEETLKLIPKISSHNSELGAQMTQHSQNVGVQLQQSNQAVRPDIVKASLEENFAEMCPLDLDDLINVLRDKAASANETFRTNLLMDRIHYSPNAARVAEEQSWVKPALWYLMIEEGEEQLVLVLSVADATQYQTQILENRILHGRSVSLVNAIGQAVQSNRDDDDEFLQSSRFLEWRVQLQLLQGRLGNLEERQRLRKMMQAWPKDQFESLWKQIQLKSVDPIPQAQISAMGELIEEVYEVQKKPQVRPRRVPIPNPVIPAVQNVLPQDQGKPAIVPSVPPVQQKTGPGINIGSPPPLPSLKSESAIPPSGSPAPQQRDPNINMGSPPPLPSCSRKLNYRWIFLAVIGFTGAAWLARKRLANFVWNPLSTMVGNRISALFRQSR